MGRWIGRTALHRSDKLRSSSLYHLGPCLMAVPSGSHSHPLKSVGATWHSHSLLHGGGGDTLTCWASFHWGQNLHMYEKKLLFLLINKGENTWTIHRYSPQRHL